MQSNVIKCCQILSNCIKCNKKSCLSRFIVASRRSILSPPLWLSLCILDDVCSYPEEYWQYFDQKYKKTIDHFDQDLGKLVWSNFQGWLFQSHLHLNVLASEITLTLCVMMCALIYGKNTEILIRNTITKSY